MAFYTIYVTPGLSPADDRRARRSGPPAGGSRQALSELLHAAGFSGVREVDVTRPFERTQRAWLRERLRRQRSLRKLIGDEEFDLRQHNGDVQLRAIEDGLLRRALFVVR
jgi:hypothetical protein